MSPAQLQHHAKLEYEAGVRAAQSGRPDIAVHHFSRAVSLSPDIAELHGNLGNALLVIGQTDAAIAAFRKATELRPDVPEFHHHLGCALLNNVQPDAAITAISRAIELKPGDAVFHKHLGIALHDSGRFDESMLHLSRSIKLQPDSAQAHWTLGLLHLLRGDFQRGWPEFDWRWRDPSAGLHRDFSAPLWNGQELNGKTILLHAEQGLGDTIQFIRYAPFVAQRGARVFVECQQELVRLLEDFPTIEKPIPRGHALPPFDFHCPLMRLPLIFGTTSDSIPAAVPYIHQKPAPHAASVQLRVGLVWAGRPEHRNDRNRSVRLAQLAPLADIAGVDFYTLQKGEPAAQGKTPPPGMRLLDRTADLHDFADTAALIAELDLIITVDTAIAHLAGAMAKPTAVLLPFVPDWRWMCDRQDTPWYPTLHLFRQESAGNWEGAIRRVCDWLGVQKKRGRCSP